MILGAPPARIQTVEAALAAKQDGFPQQDLASNALLAVPHAAAQLSAPPAVQTTTTPPAIPAFPVPTPLPARPV